MRIFQRVQSGRTIDLQSAIKKMQISARSQIPLAELVRQQRCRAAGECSRLDIPSRQECACAELQCDGRKPSGG